MNQSTIVFLINDEVRAVRASYEDGVGANDYTFKTFDPLIAVDDLVVVPTDTRHKMTVVKITEVDIEMDLDTDIEIKWIVSRIDQTAHDETLAMEKDAITAVRSAERARKKDELRAAVFKDQADKIGSLALAHSSDVTEEMEAGVSHPSYVPPIQSYNEDDIQF